MVDVGNCLFCNKGFLKGNTIIYSNKYWNTIYDGFPLTKGHTLIIPKRHISSMFNLKLLEILFLIIAIFQTKNILVKLYHPQGFNLGINDGKVSGQTIMHLHVHLIPRYENDGGLPCGIRNIFPKEKANYINEKRNI